MVFINNFTQNKFLRVLLILFLIICIVFVSFVCTLEPAHALIGIDDAMLCIVGSLLLSAGITYANQAARDASVSSFYNSVSLDVKQELEESVKNLTYDDFRAKYFPTPTIISAISNWISSLFDSATGEITLNPSGLSFDGIDLSKFPLNDYDSYMKSSWQDKRSLCINADAIFAGSSEDFKLPKLYFPNEELVSCSFWESDSYLRFSYSVKLSDGSVVFPASNLSGNSFSGACILKNSSDVYYLAFPRAWNSGDDYEFRIQSTMTSFPKTTIKPNTTYFPKDVPGSGSKPLTTDIPISVPKDAGTLIGQTPADVRTDAGAGAGTGTILGWLAKLFDAIISIPSAIVNAFADFFNPSGFDLDFSGFKLGLTKVFPFCIPFDLVRGVKTLVTDSSGFNFDINLKTSYFKIDHTVNLAPFKIPILFFRFIVDFWFCYILISRTKDWIKW